MVLHDGVSTHKLQIRHDYFSNHVLITRPPNMCLVLANILEHFPITDQTWCSLELKIMICKFPAQKRLEILQNPTQKKSKNVFRILYYY